MPIDPQITLSPLLTGATVTGSEILARDWSQTSLGPIAGWPPALRTTLATMLACPTPMFLAWGPDLLCFYNDAYRPILGYRLDTALGRPFRMVWDSIWTDIEPLVAATLAGESQTLTDLPLDLSRRGIAEESWWSFTYSPAFDDEGRIAGLFCVTGETTAKVVAERELRESNEELLRYTYVISHDLRAPLVNVMGFASEIRELKDDVRAALGEHPEADTIDRELGEAVGFINAAVSKMDGLIAAILRLSRDGQRRLEPEPLGMATIVKGLADSIRHQTVTADARIEIAPDLPDVTADRGAIEQVFGNILDNAVKYLAPGRPGLVTVTGEQAGPRVVYRIADNGRGIASHDQARVFDLFRRSGPQDRPGDGIGLSQVMALMRALGGRIALSSELGEGTTFTLTLPARSAIALQDA